MNEYPAEWPVTACAAVDGAEERAENAESLLESGNKLMLRATERALVAEARVAELETALVQFRYEDCPDTLCLARAEMIADVTPMSPGSKNMLVKPTGMRIQHAAACPIGRAMHNGFRGR